MLAEEFAHRRNADDSNFEMRRIGPKSHPVIIPASKT